MHSQFSVCVSVCCDRGRSVDSRLPLEDKLPQPQASRCFVFQRRLTFSGWLSFSAVTSRDFARCVHSRNSSRNFAVWIEWVVGLSPCRFGCKAVDWWHLHLARRARRAFAGLSASVIGVLFAPLPSPCVASDNYPRCEFGGMVAPAADRSAYLFVTVRPVRC